MTSLAETAEGRRDDLPGDKQLFCLINKSFRFGPVSVENPMLHLSLYAQMVPGCVHVCLRFAVDVGSSGV